MFCLKVDEHPSSDCPYRKRVPKNATVGNGCDMVCSVCGWFFGGRFYDQDEAHAIFKSCCICEKIDMNTGLECPQVHAARGMKFLLMMTFIAIIRAKKVWPLSIRSEVYLFSGL